MTPTKLQEHIRLTYFRLRVGLGLLALVFPVFLASYGYFIEQIPLQKSISAYYFAFVPENSPLRVFPMRGFFVGILWAIGWFLILYRGFTDTENWLLNFAGFSAIAVAIFPMEASCAHCASVDFSRWHYRFAVALFVFIALVAWFCNKDSLRELEEEQNRKKEELKGELGKLRGEPQRKEELEKKLRHLERIDANYFRWVYISLGVLMILLPLTAVVMTYYFEVYDWKIFTIEWAGIWVFSSYWLAKSYELSLSKADKKAAMGEMTATEPTAKVSETIRQVSESISKAVSSKIASLRK